MITSEELLTALSTCESPGLPKGKKSIGKIMDQVDYKGNGKINYSEFLAATVPL